VIPLVTASEQGTAQTLNLAKLIFSPNCSLSNLIIFLVSFKNRQFMLGIFFSFIRKKNQPQHKLPKDPWKGTA